MSNDNTPENKDLDPVVQAVVNALNDRSKFQPSYIKQNLAEQTQVEEGVMDFDNNTIVVDIYEEDGKIVGIDNGVIFSNDDLPGVDYLEAYYGTEYVEDMINEAISSIELSEATKPVAKPKPAAKPAAKPVAKPKPAPAKPAPAKPAPAKPAAGKPTPAKPTPAKPAAGKPAAGKKPTTGNTKVTPAKGTASKTPPSDGLQPVTVTGKRSASKTPPSDGLEPVKVTGKRMPTKGTADELQPVTVTGRRSASQTPPGGGDAPADGEQKPGFLSKVGNFFNNTEVGQGLKKVAGDALIGGIGSKLTGGSFSQGAKAGAVGSLVGQTGKAAYDDITGRDDEEEGETQANQTPPQQSGRTGSGSGASGSVPVRYSIDGRQVEKDEYQSQRGDLDQDVVFNVKSKAGRRSIKAGDPEYQTYMDRYKKMRSVVQEALIRMGAVLTEEGWMLNDELLESVYTECDLGNIESPYFYDATGRLRIMTESEWVNLSLAEAVVERLIAESMDEVGEEDEDVDNDGDSDDSDDYLKNRREKIAAKMKEMNEMVRKPMKKLPPKSGGIKRPMPAPTKPSMRPRVNTPITPAQKRMMDTGFDPNRYREFKQLQKSVVDPKTLALQQMSTQDAVALGATGAQALNTPLKSGAKGSGSGFLNKVAGKMKSSLAAGPGKVPALGNEIAGDNIPEYDATNPKSAQPKPKPTKSAMMESNPFPWRK